MQTLLEGEHAKLRARLLLAGEAPPPMSPAFAAELERMREALVVVLVRRAAAMAAHRLRAKDAAAFARRRSTLEVEDVHVAWQSVEPIKFI